MEYVKTRKLEKICEITTWECQVRDGIGNPPGSDLCSFAKHYPIDGSEEDICFRFNLRAG
jgi:hypothetical protein